MRKLDELKSGNKFMKLIPDKKEDIKIRLINTINNLKKWLI